MTQSRLSAVFLWVLAGLGILLAATPPLPAAQRAPERAGRDARTEWKAGTATVSITPKQPIWMAGYASREKPSEGVAQQIYAKALALEDRRGNRAVIVTSDLLGFPRAVSEPIAERVRQRFGLARERVVFTSSHIHSGPVVRESLIAMYPLDAEQAAVIRAYTAWLQEQVEEAVGAALNDLAPAHLALARGEAGFAMNRREWRDGRVVLGVNPDGPVDHDVPVLLVTRPDGALRAVLFSYACHSTTLGGDYYRIHGDFGGVAQELIEKAHPGATALFMLGCGGDANPHPRGNVELAEKHGQALAASVEKVLAGGPGSASRPVHGPLRAVFDRVDLPFAPLPTREEFQARLEDTNVHVQRHARAMLKTLGEKGALPASYPYPVQVLQFGNDLTFVALAGEVVVEYGLRLKRELGAAAPAGAAPGKASLWVVAYANDVFAYLASKKVLEEGGYEADRSMIYYAQPNRWAPEVEDTVIRKVHQLVRKVR